MVNKISSCVFISGNGSNLKSLIKNQEHKCVVCNKELSINGDKIKCEDEKLHKDDAKCNCSHIKEDHEEGKDDDSCLFEDCDCKKFETIQYNFLKKKKVVSDIIFLTEAEVKDDVLAWNCFSVNKYTEKK